MAERDDEWFQRVIEGLRAAVYVTDADGYVQYHNRAVVELIGVEPGRGETLSLNLFLPDGTPLPDESSPMVIARKEQRVTSPMEMMIERPDGSRKATIAYPTPLRDGAGTIVNLFVDISERKDSEAQSRALLSQLIHREKNEIQTIQSLLSGAQRETASQEAKDVLADTGRRVGAVAAAQGVVDRKGGKVFTAEALLDAVCRSSIQSFGRKVDVQVDQTSGVLLPNRAALPLAIIISELVSNAAKHAIGDRSRVAVRLSLTSQDGRSVLTVQDDGPGFTPGPAKKRASGLGLIHGLARQLGGALEVTNEKGARCVVRFGE